MLHKKSFIILFTMMAAVGMSACGEKDAAETTRSGEEIIEVVQEFEEIVETGVDCEIIESVCMDEILTAYEDAEPLPEGARLIIDMDSITVREDGSVLVQAQDENGETVVLIYENEEAQKKSENPTLAPADEVEMAIIEISYR